jgi:hypothetical protein
MLEITGSQYDRGREQLIESDRRVDVKLVAT